MDDHDENQNRPRLLERCELKASTQAVDNVLSSCASDYQVNCQSNVVESCQVDMLREQLSHLTPNSSANDDGNCNLGDDVSTTTTAQKLNSVPEPAAEDESTEGDSDSIESFKLPSLPSPPKGSPGAAVANDSGLVSTALNDVVDSMSSPSSMDSPYIRSCASSDLPSRLHEDEERLIWPSVSSSIYRRL